MAISDAVQTLSAAFSFGILLQAATGALLLYVKGHGSTIFKDGRRLALVLFLLFAALWAQIDFLNLLILKPTLCQVTIIFSTAFDQLARFSFEQFLVWSMAQRMKVNVGQMVLQAIVGLRLIAGGILVGFTRTDFAPVCIARTLVEPFAIVVIVFDFLVIGVLLIRSVSVGIFQDMRDSRSSTRDQSRGLILSIVGFTVWTAVSVAMQLGVPTNLLIVRTLVPANGLLILVGILTFSSGSLLEAREEITTPEAHSPFVAPGVPSMGIFENGSPISVHNYSKSGGLFVVNPSFTPSDLPTAGTSYFQGSVPGPSRLGEEVTVRDLGAGRPALKVFPGYRGSSGAFPTQISASMDFDQGALAPQTRPNVIDSTRNVPVPHPTAQQKKSLFSRSKQPEKPSVRSLNISKPVVGEDNSFFQQPFAKIPTIELAQAAANERERREAAADRSRLVANRPAPHPPQQLSMPATEALRKSISIKRKEMPIRTQSRELMSSSALSVNAINGSTTSASLSPGREEIRRRSPRNANSFDKSIDEKTRPLPTLECREAIGVPSNAKPVSVDPAHHEAEEQTVMFMSDIVYDNPSIVKTIIDAVPQMYASAQKPKASAKTPDTSYTLDLKSGDSMIHRPRPYGRVSDGYRALFPSEVSTNRRRRTKSGGSITSRKSILMSHPGSPTRLPPLPTPPTVAQLQRLLPHGTRGMTADEKIQLLFPAPPAATIIHNRRSSVSSLPRVPSAFMSETPMVQSPIQDAQQIKRTSKRMTIASFGLLESTEAIKDDRTYALERRPYQPSAHTYRGLADQVDEMWLQRTPVNETNTESLAPGVIDMDSHNLQDRSQSNITKTSFSNNTGDSLMYWGSIHSEVPPVDSTKEMKNAHSTFIQRSRDVTLDEVKPAPPPKDELHPGEGIMTVMLEREESCHSIVTSMIDNQQTFFLETDQSLPGDKTPTVVKTWHRRIGDDLPTFSERKAITRSRKMPPPTPLLLNNRGRVAAIVFRGAEPSPPMIDSPERAIAEIQAQLKRFEVRERGSVGTDAAADKDRFKLLENLENEVGQQENRWQQMQTDLHRESVSTIATTPGILSENEMSRESSQKSSWAPSIAASRCARISTTIRSKGDGSTSTVARQSAGNSRASIWQQRLAEAQMEYMENTPALLLVPRLNFLSISNSHQLGSPTPPESVDSGTDTQTDSEMESESEQASVDFSEDIASLWKPRSSSPPRRATGRMWNHSYETNQRAISPEPPAKHIRPAQRLINLPLRITSSDLWSKPTSAANSRPVVGLWASKLVRPVRIRPVTQKPSRTSKRVTLLPDILESPVPLPNNRDTLGIFQFPWGETSDSAVYQPAFNPALLSGPILDARSRQLEPESEYSSSFFDDYDEEDEIMDSDDDFDETTLWEIVSLLKNANVPNPNRILSSARNIIEDYEDEDETETETEFEKDEEEAEDTYQAKKPTLRPMTEIPILPLALSPRKEVNKKSLLWTTGLATAIEVTMTGLPQPEPQVWQGYVSLADDIVRSNARPSPELPILVSHTLWTVPKLQVASSSHSHMWSGITTPAVRPVVVQQKSSFLWRLPATKPEQCISGLFSLDTQRSVFRTTEATPAAISMILASRPSNCSLPPLSSKSLWVPEQFVKKENKVWTSAGPISKAPVQSLWTPTPRVESIAVIGLFCAAHSRSDYRTTSLLPAAQKMAIKVRSSTAPLSQLTSTRLWSGCHKLAFEHHWISESSIRPSSPSVYSESSSVSSSPISETASVSGASLKSTSTKASSLWGSIRSATTPAWVDTKSTRKTPSSQSLDNSKPLSRLPLAKRMGLDSVRESRVLASRDLWELRVPVALGETPKRSFTVKKSTALPPPEQDRIEHQPRRLMATPQLWASALEEAHAKSVILNVVAPPKYDPAIRHPVFFADSLVSRTSDIHPAAIGYATDNTTQYYAAVLHPVFFASSLTTCATEIYPAAIGHVARHEPKSLWTARFHIAGPESPIGPMWLKGKTAASRFEHDKTPTVRRAFISGSNPLSKLESSYTWQPQSAPDLERNWINSAKEVHSLTWTAAKNVLVEESKDLWTKKPVLNISSPGLFSHHTAAPIKKSSPRPVMLPLLSSNELFTPTSLTIEKTHWLHSTSTSQARSVTVAPKTIRRSQTWSAKPVTELPEKETSMWALRPVQVVVRSPTIFPNPHSEPWMRKKRSDLGVEVEEYELESSQMWSRNWVMTESPREWLKIAEKRANKVY